MKRFTFLPITTCSSASRIDHTMKSQWRLMLLLLMGFGTSGLTSITTANAQDPPQYQLTWLGDGRPRDINEAGLVAFGWSPYIYDHVTGVKIDLNDPLYGATWIDLEDQGDETGQWTVWHCNGINESDQIIGTASHVSGSEADRNFVLNDPLGTPVFELIPTNVLDGSTYNVCINDLGDVAVGREINNAGVIAGGESVGLPQGTVVLPDGSFETFEGHYFTGINDSGFITGYRNRKNGKSGWGNAGPILFDYPGDPGPEDLIQSGTSTNYHGDLNNLNNVAYSSNGAGHIYIFESDSAFNLDDLIVNDPSSQAYLDWINTTIYPSGINDAGQIIGQGQIDGAWQGFILDPIVPGPTISVADITLNEGNAGTSTPAQFTVTLSRLTGQDVTVSYQIVDGTATVGEDYNATASGLLTFSFAAGETSKTVPFTIIGDGTQEPDETFTIVLNAPFGGAEIGDGTGTATIMDDDAPSITITVDDPSIVEGDNGDQSPGQFTINLSAAATGNVDVFYNVTNGSAKKNRDYQMVDAASGLLSFNPGETSKTVAFVILGDNKPESNETFKITLSDAFGATIDKAVGTTTIVDDD